MQTFISKSEQDTIDFAENFAKELTQGDIVVLSGELGSGKTKFVQGVLRHFGLENEISSPTFTIVNEYTSPAANIYHFDVYRLEDADEFYAMGGDEYFESGICLIEWGEMIEDILPTPYTKITFSKADGEDNYRKLEIETIEANKVEK